MGLSPLFKPVCSVRQRENGNKVYVRTASNSGCGSPKFSSTWFTAGRYLRLLDVKFSYLQARVGRYVVGIVSLTYLHTLKLPMESALNQSRGELCAHLLIPIFLILPLSTNSSSFFHVG